MRMFGEDKGVTGFILRVATCKRRSPSGSRYAPHKKPPLRGSPEIEAMGVKEICSSLNIAPSGMVRTISLPAAAIVDRVPPEDDIGALTRCASSRVTFNTGGSPSIQMVSWLPGLLLRLTLR